jgi:meiotically up-regulated gene 157 (Mug157) protein
MKNGIGYPAVTDLLDQIGGKLKDHPELSQIFRQCFLNTLDTTIVQLPNTNTFVITGDIPAMWLRDSSAQVHSYLPLAARDANLALLL